jgi:3-hydroxyacyl-CoA dehydrogenase/enoyl-CoA hydratase/3-hydroxybutyryl-CoA epimerase/enoyl-CoA isomerase
VGIDTGVHAGAVMAEGFPERMKYDFKTCHEVMFENERFGQKNGRGYYAYEADKKGRPKKILDEEVAALLAPVIDGSETLDDEAIVDSMMIPMCLEAVRCLEDGIAASATDVESVFRRSGAARCTTSTTSASTNSWPGPTSLRRQWGR